ncbi:MULTISPECIES: EutP/PduV family microcompartment system protein [unclassified Clostridioides]|uniref:EutP/PduV family microcompartment system protein n=1 Tax=unclassified Clostridioides TaxID=2635829 RepID=UPI001D101864|nr:EutP/PduV family microcompartment system protein [Clostridioides sp. ZZV15-6388]MCC0645167.1 EutP/PduV family microcompartment system protein [Clostridioides sp. ZZV14-6150]MCC0661228.1 EutP/PduV family microcompartment system protein [Clostridioides sp. ZZV14-6154]MCC0663173.1 EutP/PduV family microcompartment system protein [Clostridioides sp. ZZV15-6597]MCC0669049.1 EutP/PduV family microcompartment system protein [Clostridioides sp. ZZV14-6153]MCC0719509.1 EutP/PduV family microcompartm
MKNIIFMGKTSSGKTTLCQKLDELEIRYKKTQSIEIYKNAIDTPGEYMENRALYNALITTAVDAKVVAIVYDATQEENYMAPGFASIFCKETIGIMTKINKLDKNQIDLGIERLTLAGVNKIFKVDTIDDVGIDELFEYLNEIRSLEEKY